LLRVGQIILIVLLAWLFQRLLNRGITRLGSRYPQLPGELLMPLSGLLRWLILGSAFMLVLERLGVSAQVLWAALTGFSAVAAIAFFAIWSVLSNMFCALLIFAMGPFRMGDCVEVLESATKPGVRGRVVAINLFYTTL
jgi:small-conductance mechanosensitive channel